MTMKAAEIMTTEVAKIKGSETVAKAVKMLTELSLKPILSIKSSLSVKIRKRCAFMK